MIAWSDPLDPLARALSLGWTIEELSVSGEDYAAACSFNKSLPHQNTYRPARARKPPAKEANRGE